MRVAVLPSFLLFKKKHMSILGKEKRKRSGKDRYVCYNEEENVYKTWQSV